MKSLILDCRHIGDIELPREVSRLYDLAYNLWWSWNPAARSLFDAIDSSSWVRYRNPVQMLINVEPARWAELLESESFMTAYAAVMRDFERYVGCNGECWFRRQHPEAAEDLVAYFSMEYGLHHCLPLYSGGLGVLSGDHCKSASDLGLPFVAVGLLYRHGYFRQSVDANGWQQHMYPEYDFSRLPLRPAAGPTGREVLVDVPLLDRTIAAKVWVAQIGRVPLLLLDTDVPQNDPADRPITDILYVQGREMRLVQEMVLGVGGVRALRALGLAPTVWHLNEGHCALLQLERLRELIRDQKLPLAEAQEQIRRDAVFTTHTPVPAGNEQFDAPLAMRYLEPWATRLGTTSQQLLALGSPELDPAGQNLNLTAFALRTTSFANGVSELNSEVGDKMWQHLFPEIPEEERVIASITNGVHTATWLGVEVRQLLERHLGREWQDRLLVPEAWAAVESIPDRELWEAHLSQKQRLALFTTGRLREQMARHGASPGELRQLAGVLDPAIMTIGFARRFATYKRANLIFSDLERLTALLVDAERPLQFLFAGKAHPADRPGQELIQKIVQLAQSERLRGRVFFIEDYDLRVGGMLVQGVDVWLNTPRRPLEASGTSGQKAAMNGALNFSILDGWWPEAFDGKNGWAIGNTHEYSDEAKQDQEDAASFYGILETEILPEYYARDEAGMPRRWLARMKHAIATVTPGFSSCRMVRDYVERSYLPAARRHREVEQPVAAACESP